MDKLALLRTVWVVSPADASELVSAAFEAISQWNRQHQAGTVRFEAIHWLTDGIPEVNEEGAPAAIEQQFERLGVDMMVAVFKDTLGTPVGSYESGTVREIKRNVARKRQTWCYFFEKPLDGLRDPVESRRLMEFKTWIKENGLMWPVSGPDNLKKMLLTHLVQYNTAHRPGSFNVLMALCHAVDVSRFEVAPRDFAFKPIQLLSDCASYGYQVFEPRAMSTKDPYEPWQIVGTFNIPRTLRVSKAEIWRNMREDPKNSFKFFVRVPNDEAVKARCMSELVQGDCVVTGYGDLDLDSSGQNTGLWRIWFLHQEGFVHPYLAKPYMANHSIINLVSI